MNNNNKIRILLISRGYSEHAGGMERLSYELINALRNQSGIKTTVIAHATPANVSLAQARISSALFTLKAIPKALMAARHADVVHLGDSVLSGIGWLIKVVWKKPVAVTVHGLDVNYPHPLYRLYLRLFLRHLDAYIPNSESSKLKLDPWNVTGTVTVIPPGMHDRFYSVSAVRQYSKNAIVLLTCGRLIKRKGHEWFIRRVLPKLPSRYIYVIAGDGPEKQRIQKAIEETSVNDRVHLLGRVTEDVLRNLYNTADAFVQPNVSVTGDAEGFGIVLLEAALCERLVFASRIDGIPAAIHDGKNGTLINPEDPEAWISVLARLENFPYPRKNSSSRAYTLKHFSWDQIAKQYLNALQALL